MNILGPKKRHWRKHWADHDYEIVKLLTLNEAWRRLHRAELAARRAHFVNDTKGVDFPEEHFRAIWDYFGAIDDTTRHLRG